jgi:hypothetical protein
MLIKLPNIRQQNEELDLGCIVDTNVVFAATFPLDTHNEWADQVFNKLQSSKIPIFTNINIRSEFIELNRRVLIPECLVDFYDAMRGFLNPEIEHKLKSLKTLKARATSESRAFKLSDSEIKKFRHLLSAIEVNETTNGWTLFCRDYFHQYITTVWDSAINDLGIQFLGTRAIESKDYFNGDPKWTDMLDIIGNSGIGSSDAMIINLFLQSKLPLIVTADSDVKDTVISMMPTDKYILAP